MSNQQIVENVLRLTEGKSEGFRYRHSFSPNTARIWIRANFHCEYCDQNMLESVMAFQSFQYDHILPQAHYQSNPLLSVTTGELFRAKIFSEDELSNFALSCRLCNSIKSSFDANAESPIYPGEGGLDDDVRRELIRRVRDRIAPVRKEHQEMFEMVRDLVANCAVRETGQL